MKTFIIIFKLPLTKINPLDIEVFTTLTKLCEKHLDFKYSYLKSKKFPFTYKGWTFYKIEVNN